MANHRNSEFGSGNNPTGYLLPELPEVTAPDSLPRIRAGRLALGAVLLSTAALAAEPAHSSNEPYSGNLPAAATAQSPHRIEHRPSHLTRIKAIAAVAVHKASTNKPPKITAHLASISSTSPTKRFRFQRAPKVSPVPSYAIT